MVQFFSFCISSAFCNECEITNYALVTLYSRYWLVPMTLADLFTNKYFTVSDSCTAVKVARKESKVEIEKISEYQK